MDSGKEQWERTPDEKESTITSQENDATNAAADETTDETDDDAVCSADETDDDAACSIDETDDDAACSIEHECSPEELENVTGGRVDPVLDNNGRRRPF